MPEGSQFAEVRRLTEAAITSPVASEPKLIYSSTGSCAAEVYFGDALKFLSGLPEASADLVFLDPPFNLGKKYSRSIRDSMSAPDYLAWMLRIIDQAVRVLGDGGAIYLYHLPSWAVEFGHHLGKSLQFRHWIAVSMKNGFVRGKRLYPAHYALLFYTKGSPTILKRPKLQVEYCDCGKTRKDYGGYLPIVKEKGLNLSDVWDDVSPVRHRNRKRRKANELPARITERVVEISGAPGLVFVDPFAGAGSAILAAAKAGMSIKACDIVRTNTLIQARALRALALDMEGG